MISPKYIQTNIIKRKCRNVHPPPRPIELLNTVVTSLSNHMHLNTPRGCPVTDSRKDRWVGTWGLGGSQSTGLFES